MTQVLGAFLSDHSNASYRPIECDSYDHSINKVVFLAAALGMGTVSFVYYLSSRETPFHNAKLNLLKKTVEYATLAFVFTVLFCTSSKAARELELNCALELIANPCT